jgi:hypothetical protein
MAARQVQVQGLKDLIKLPEIPLELKHAAAAVHLLFVASPPLQALVNPPQPFLCV